MDTLPPELEFREELVTLSKGNSCCVGLTVSNKTNHNIRLSGHTPLVQIYLVKSVTPADVKLKEYDDNRMPSDISDTAKVHSTTVDTDANGTVDSKSDNVTQVTDNHEQKQGVIPNVAIGEHLAEEKRSAVLCFVMFSEESNAFSSNDNDDGDIKGLQLELKLFYPTPVQKPYITIPHPLYQEVKQYMEDLINRGWIMESKSPYSLGCVIVRN